MRIFNGLDHLPEFRRPVITVGSYDGVHAGHKELLSKIVEIAARKEGESIVVTFSPHPRSVLNEGRGRVKLLNSLEEKAMLLERAGVDNMVVVPFTEHFAEVSSHDFVKYVLIGQLGVDTLVVGFNHHFGHNQEGNFDYLNDLRDKYGFEVYEIAEQDVDERKVSSTVIRRLLQEGRMSEASKYLGYSYFVMGHIGRHKELIPSDADKVMPPDGVYEVTLREAGNGEYPAIARIREGVIELACARDLAGGDKVIIFFNL